MEAVQGELDKIALHEDRLAILETGHKETKMNKEVWLRTTKMDSVHSEWLNEKKLSKYGPRYHQMANPLKPITLRTSILPSVLRWIRDW